MLTLRQPADGPNPPRFGLSTTENTTTQTAPLPTTRREDIDSQLLPRTCAADNKVRQVTTSNNVGAGGTSAGRAEPREDDLGWNSDEWKRYL